MRTNLLIALALAAGTFLVFAPVARHDYINLDDPAYVPDNPHVNAGLTAAGVRWAFTTYYVGNWHPVTWLSHMLDVQLFGLKAGPQHLMNVAIHAANGAWLFLALFALTKARWESATVAALFAWHPLRVESVAWIAERKDVLSGFFFMAVLWCYARYAGQSKVRSPRAKVWYAAALGAFVLGLMSKPMLVSVPFVLLLLDVWPLKRLGWRGPWLMPVSPAEPDAGRTWLQLGLEKIPFFLLTAVFCGVTLLSQSDVGAVVSFDRIPLPHRVINALNSIVMYAVNTLWPDRLNPFYAFDAPTPGWTMMLFFLLAAGTVTALWVRRRLPFLIVGWLWYLVMLAPVLGLIQVGSQARADRYTYLPTLGLLVALVWLVSGLTPKTKLWRIALTTFTVAAVAALGLGTRHQLAFWQNAITLCERSVRIEPRDARSHYNLGCTLEKTGDRDGAIQHFTAAIAASAAYTKAHNNLGSALASQGDFVGAEFHFRAALKLNPDHTSARMNLARALANQNKFSEALEQLQSAPEKDQSLPALQGLIGDLLVSLGRVREAVPVLERLVKAAPSAELHAKLATLDVQIHEPKAAVAHYHAALKFKPDWPELLNNLAWTLTTTSDASVRNGAEAIGFAGRACELTQHQHPGFLLTLAAAYAEAGQFDQAISAAQKAMALATGNAQLSASIAPLLESFLNHKPYRLPPPEPAPATAK